MVYRTAAPVSIIYDGNRGGLYGCMGPRDYARKYTRVYLLPFPNWFLVRGPPYFNDKFSLIECLNRDHE